jgi:hypothetical protein
VNRLLVSFLILLVSAVHAPAQNPAPKIKPNAPAKEFRLPTFDKNGRRESFMRAGEAFFVTPNQIDVKDVHVSLFTKDGTGAFDTVLLAPSATYFKDQKIVSGKESVRLIRLDLEVTGEQWSYHHLEERVVIGKNARVIFQDELTDIIK